MDTRVVIITGASSGIGAAVARRLAKDGCRLTLAARRTDRLEQLAQEVRTLGGEALVVPADVSHLADIERIVDASLERWGRVDVLFNNAGVGLDDELSVISAEAIHTELMINLEAVILSARQVLPIMLKQKSGHIINTSSMAGLVAVPKTSIYCASKSGVVGFSDALRRELRGSGVHVSAFCPGFTPSEISERMKAHYEGRPDAAKVPGLMPNTYVADQVRWLINHPRRIFVIPKTWRVLVLLAYFFPWLADMLVTKFGPQE
jgi:short-subunit dehydrogenase